MFQVIGGQQMPGEAFKPEQTINKLRGIEDRLSRGNMFRLSSLPFVTARAYLVFTHHKLRTEA